MPKKLTIQAMQQLAESHCGRCLSDAYVGTKAKLLWQCAKGHQWMAAPSGIQQGKWCPQCGGKVRLTIQEMHRLATNRGGKCLSDTYDNAKTPLLWQCQETKCVPWLEKDEYPTSKKFYKVSSFHS